MSRTVKVSNLGWLCMESEGEWIAICQLTKEQCAEWNKVAQPDVLAVEQGLKVYGWSSFRTECPAAPNGSRQTREVVAAKSLAAAARAADTNPSTFRRNSCETANPAEVRAALSAPGTVFWRPLNHHRGPYVKAGDVPAEWKVL